MNWTDIIESVKRCTHTSKESGMMTVFADVLRKAPNQSDGSNYKKVCVQISVIVKNIRSRHKFYKISTGAGKIYFNSIKMYSLLVHYPVNIITL